MPTATSVQTRIAVAEDLESLVTIGLRFARESVYAQRMPITEAGVRGLVQWVLAHGVIWLSVKDDHPVAVFGMTILPHMLTGQLYAAEVFWWSNPEERGHGLRLFYTAQAWAKAQGVTMMQLVAPTPDAEQLYARLGYTKIEAVYTKDFVC